MSPEIADPSQLSEEDQSRIEYFKKERPGIIEKYLWTPVTVHTTREFWMWVRKNISLGEGPPFYGILNPCDDKGNLVLHPWVRNYDRSRFMWSFLTGREPEAPFIGMTEMDHLCQGVDEFCEGIADTNFGVKLLAQCPRGLKIPWTELVMISRAVEFLPNRGRD